MKPAMRTPLRHHLVPQLLKPKIRFGVGFEAKRVCRALRETTLGPYPGFSVSDQSIDGRSQSRAKPSEEIRYHLPLGVGLQNHRHIRHRRPLTESFVLLAQAFDTAWLELREIDPDDPRLASIRRLPVVAGVGFVQERTGLELRKPV